MHLLDINMLIALLDSHHIHHRKTRKWFLKCHRDGWATCPLTENGFIRIFGHANYPGGPQSTEDARLLLASLCRQPGYQFWPDDVSLCRRETYARLPGSKHLSDYYLLALAITHKARLTTLDARIDATMLKGGARAYHIL